MTHRLQLYLSLPRCLGIQPSQSIIYHLCFVGAPLIAGQKCVGKRCSHRGLGWVDAVNRSYGRCGTAGRIIRQPNILIILSCIFIKEDESSFQRI